MAKKDSISAQRKWKDPAVHKSASAGSIKKKKTAFHKEKFKKSKGSLAQHNQSKPLPVQRSTAEKSKEAMDIHVASKLSQDLRRDISLFKQRHTNDELSRCSEVHPFFSLISSSFIAQHIPADVREFSSYLTKFYKGSVTLVNGFLLWFEWACYEKNKGTKFGSPKSSFSGEEQEINDDSSKRTFSAARQAMAKTYKEREHVRSLLAMCVRHNSEQRKAGQHTFINFLNSKLVEDDADARTLEALKNTVHHSVAFALSRLVLGMAEENFAMMVLNFHALFLVLTRTQIPPGVILSIIDQELSLGERMKACRMRVTKSNSIGDEMEEEIDPDDIADPTKGERNQRLAAAVFALGAIVVSRKYIDPEDASRLSKFLCFCYVEQKSTRVISANLLFQFVRCNENVLLDEEAFQWMVFAFFSYPKLEYYRPEAVQYLLLLMGREKILSHFLPPAVLTYLRWDPLEPANLEQICTALFRKEQVTAVHPMIHPIWNDIIDLMIRRCEAGESMKAHFSTFIHTVVIPYRRGNADLPRRALFQKLVTKLGEIAVRNSDAQERLELLHMASKNAGYGRSTAAKPSTPEQLKQLPESAMTEKVEDLIMQYKSIKDGDPAATTNRRWVLRELRACLSVPVVTDNAQQYVNSAVSAFLSFGFFPPFNSRDHLNQNHCVYLFSEFFSFTYAGASSRPKCTLRGLDIISAYLIAEEKTRTRFNTAVQKSTFRKARNMIVEALEKKQKRSVLFYDDRDMEILLTLLFLVLSIDDPSNSEAKNMAATGIPDLVHFFLHGTIETLDLLYDVFMSINMRISLPVQVVSLMTSVRRICTGFMIKYSKFIRSTSALDAILAPLRDAYNTDHRELLRQQRAAQPEGASEDDENSIEDSEGDEQLKVESDSVETTDTSSETGTDEEDTSSVSSTESDVTVESETQEGMKATDDPEVEQSDEDVEELQEEEVPTEEYIQALKGMIGDVDLEHVYPTDTVYAEQRDSVRAIQLAGRVGKSLNSPLASDETVFTAALRSIDLLLLSKNRYFGVFIDPTGLFQILGDIQSYCRKSVRSLLQSNTTAKAASTIRYRMDKLKCSALRVFHFISYLAYKNHAEEGVRIVLSEYYKSIFCDRGWKTSAILGDLKQDIFYYRQGYVWALLPAVFEKFSDVAAIDSPQRARVFCGCCTVIETLLPRLTRLPGDLKHTTKREIAGFLQSVSLEDVYSMKRTLPYFYLHTIKMVLKYNSRVGLDTHWVENDVLKVAIDNDDIKMTGATIRVLTTIERLLNVTPRAKETKAPVPMKSLFQEFNYSDEKHKEKQFPSAKRVRSKALKRFLAFKSGEQNDTERSYKRRRREELKVEDRLQRQVLRDPGRKILSKEEKEEKRKRIMIAKQERIAKNKERKRRMHELRQKDGNSCERCLFSVYNKWRYMDRMLTLVSAIIILLNKLEGEVSAVLVWITSKMKRKASNSSKSRINLQMPSKKEHVPDDQSTPPYSSSGYDSGSKHNYSSDPYYSVSYSESGVETKHTKNTDEYYTTDYNSTKTGETPSKPEGTGDEEDYYSSTGYSSNESKSKNNYSSYQDYSVSYTGTGNDGEGSRNTGDYYTSDYTSTKSGKNLSRPSGTGDEEDYYSSTGYSSNESKSKNNYSSYQDYSVSYTGTGNDGEGSRNTGDYYTSDYTSTKSGKNLSRPSGTGDEEDYYSSTGYSSNESKSKNNYSSYQDYSVSYTGTGNDGEGSRNTGDYYTSDYTSTKSGKNLSRPSGTGDEEDYYSSNIYSNESKSKSNYTYTYSEYNTDSQYYTSLSSGYYSSYSSSKKKRSFETYTSEKNGETSDEYSRTEKEYSSVQSSRKGPAQDNHGQKQLLASKKVSSGDDSSHSTNDSVSQSLSPVEKPREYLVLRAPDQCAPKFLPPPYECYVCEHGADDFIHVFLSRLWATQKSDQHFTSFEVGGSGKVYRKGSSTTLGNEAPEDPNLDISGEMVTSKSMRLALKVLQMGHVERKEFFKRTTFVPGKNRFEQLFRETVYTQLKKRIVNSFVQLDPSRSGELALDQVVSLLRRLGITTSPVIAGYRVSVSVESVQPTLLIEDGNHFDDTLKIRKMLHVCSELVNVDKGSVALRFSMSHKRVTSCSEVFKFSVADQKCLERLKNYCVCYAYVCSLIFQWLMSRPTTTDADPCSLLMSNAFRVNYNPLEHLKEYATLPLQLTEYGEIQPESALISTTDNEEKRRRNIVPTIIDCKVVCIPEKAVDNATEIVLQKVRVPNPLPEGSRAFCLVSVVSNDNAFLPAVEVPVCDIRMSSKEGYTWIFGKKKSKEDFQTVLIRASPNDRLYIECCYEERNTITIEGANHSEKTIWCSGYASALVTDLHSATLSVCPGSLLDPPSAEETVTRKAGFFGCFKKQSLPATGIKIRVSNFSTSCKKALGLLSDRCVLLRRHLHITAELRAAVTNIGIGASNAIQAIHHQYVQKAFLVASDPALLDQLQTIWGKKKNSITGRKHTESLDLALLQCTAALAAAHNCSLHGHAGDSFESQGKINGNGHINGGHLRNGWHRFIEIHISSSFHIITLTAMIYVTGLNYSVPSFKDILILTVINKIFIFVTNCCKIVNFNFLRILFYFFLCTMSLSFDYVVNSFPSAAVSIGAPGLAECYGSRSTVSAQLLHPQGTDAVTPVPPSKKREDFIYAIDSATTKLKIPLSAVDPTQALDDDGLVPGLCRLYMEGRCRQSRRCYQVHANPTIVEQLREEVRKQPSCCHVHGAPCTYEGFPLGLTVTVECRERERQSRTINGDQSLDEFGEAKSLGCNAPSASGEPESEKKIVLSLHHLCPTSYLEHLKGLCRFGDECSFLHGCRATLAGLDDPLTKCMRACSGVEHSVTSLSFNNGSHDRWTRVQSYESSGLAPPSHGPVSSFHHSNFGESVGSSLGSRNFSSANHALHHEEKREQLLKPLGGRSTAHCNPTTHQSTSFSHNPSTYTMANRIFSSVFSAELYMVTCASTKIIYDMLIRSGIMTGATTIYLFIFLLVLNVGRVPRMTELLLSLHYKHDTNYRLLLVDKGWYERFQNPKKNSLASRKVTSSHVALVLKGKKQLFAHDDVECAIVRKIEYSNSLLLGQTHASPVNEPEKQADKEVILASLNAMYQFQSSPPQNNALRFLRASCLTQEEFENDSPEPPLQYTFTELSYLSNSSPNQLACQLKNSGAVMHRGKIRLLDTLWILSALNCVAQLPNVSCCSWDKVSELLPSLHPVVIGVLKELFQGKSEESFLDPVKVAIGLAGYTFLCRSEGIVHHTSELEIRGLRENLFFSRWLETIPSYVFGCSGFPSKDNRDRLLALLQGWAVLNKNADVIWWAPEGSLPTEVDTRLDILFELNPGSWEAESLKAIVPLESLFHILSYALLRIEINIES
eukprot:gene10238-7177_t